MQSKSGVSWHQNLRKAGDITTRNQYFHQGKLVSQAQSHYLNGNNMLTKAIYQQLNKKKKKKKTDKKIVADNYEHCRSLQKLQNITNERSDEIKKYMIQNARLHAQNEALRQNERYPSVKQQEMQLKIESQSNEINRLKLQLQNKDKKLEQQIKRINRMHQEEIMALNSKLTAQRNQKYSLKTHIAGLQIMANSDLNKVNNLSSNQKHIKPTTTFQVNRQYVPHENTVSYHQNRQVITKIQNHQKESAIKPYVQYNATQNAPTKIISTEKYDNSSPRIINSNSYQNYNNSYQNYSSSTNNASKTNITADLITQVKNPSNLNQNDNTIKTSQTIVRTANSSNQIRPIQLNNVQKISPSSSFSPTQPHPMDQTKTLNQILYNIKQESQYKSQNTHKQIKSNSENSKVQIHKIGIDQRDKTEIKPVTNYADIEEMYKRYINSN